MNFSNPNEAVLAGAKGRVIFLLALITLVQSIYPITSSGHPSTIVIYQLLYSSLLVAGIVVARDNQNYRRILIVLGIAWAVTGIIFAFNQTAIWALLGGYIVIAAFQGTLIRVLALFIFSANTITRDVLYAACAVYLLLGAVFTPIYGIIETLHFAFTNGGHAFADGITAVGEVIPWQTFVYYSYVTLTTLGYGDILPMTMWARSAASLQAIIGVLYLTIILARLVGLYATQEIEEFQQKTASGMAADTTSQAEKLG